MRAIVLEEYGGPEALLHRDIPRPLPGRGELLVRVHATSLNRADVLQRQGAYPPPGVRPQYEIPGLDFAGVVEEQGPEVVGWKRGERVFGLVTGGAYAQYLVVDERMTLRLPEALDFASGAAIPEVFIAAYDALFPLGGLKVGDIVLIHAGGSGVGTAAIQLARAAGASFIFTTLGSEWKAKRAHDLGTTRTINYREEDFDEVVLAETIGRGADVILDFVGGDYLSRNIRAAAPDGRIVQMAVLSGPKAKFNLIPLMQKRISLIGTVLRNRPPERRAVLLQQFARQALSLFEDGTLRPVIDRIYSLDEAAEAHHQMEKNLNFGKIVMTVS